jgi:hypothetical protein
LRKLKELNLKKVMSSWKQERVGRSGETNRGGKVESRGERSKGRNGAKGIKKERREGLKYKRKIIYR